MLFKCDCLTHLLKIEDFSTINKKVRIKGLSFQIYDIYSKKGRKYKKPKLTADVVIINNHYKNEYNKLVNFIKKHSNGKEKPWGCMMI